MSWIASSLKGYLGGGGGGAEESFVITRDELRYDKEKDCLGSGNFGVVYRAKCRSSLVAVKMPLLSNDPEEDKRVIEGFKEEAKIWRSPALFYPFWAPPPIRTPPPSSPPSPLPLICSIVI